MPRSAGRSSRGSAGGGGGGGSLVAVDAVLSRETSYRSGIKHNQTMAKVLAENLALDSTLEQVLMDFDADSSKAFLEKQRERLKQVSVRNVENSRGIDAFCGALKEVRQQVVNHSQQPEEELPDYEKALATKMKEFAAQQKDSQLDLRDEQFCREIRDRLGEKDENPKQGDDEDIEVMRQPEGSSTQALKCPVTGMLFEDPVRNTICGHVYSRIGIMTQIRKHKTCPVPGCPNQQQVKQSHLEEDTEMVIKVRRQKQRDERERQERMTQAMDADDSEEEVL